MRTRPTKSQKRSRPDRRSGLKAQFESATDYGLIFLLFIAPLFMGGRHPLGRLVFVAAVFVTALIWTATRIREKSAAFVFSPAVFVPLIGIFFVGLQLFPLNADWVQRLSPATVSLLPLWSSGANQVLGLQTWNRISVTPVETRISLSILVAYALLFVIVLNRIQNLRDAKRIVGWIGAASLAMGALGIVQYLLANGRFLWIYAHPTRETFHAVKGTFANPNHFAHFVAIGLGALIWLAAKHANPSSEANQVLAKREVDIRRMLCFGALSTAILACVLSFSRGGILMTLLGISICIVIAWRSGQITKRMTISLAAIGATCVVALGLHGMVLVKDQITSLDPRHLVQESSAGARATIWSADARGVAVFKLFGSGAGSHRDVYPTFLKQPSDVEFTHAESGFLQVVLETGAFGGVLLGISLLLAIAWSVQVLRSTSGEDRLFAGAVVAGLTISIVHSIFDFVWYVPACMTMSIFLMAVVLRLFQMHQETTKTFAWPKSTWVLAFGGIAIAGFACTQPLVAPAQASRHWDNYLTLSMASNTQKTAPNRGRLRYAKRVSLESIDNLQQLTMELQQVVAIDPNNSRAHSRLASLYLQAFDLLQAESENPMGVHQFRDAAYASQFESQAKLYQWMEAAAGENFELLQKSLRHARTAIKLCPLDGISYVYLSELAFLQNPNSKLKDVLLQQAALVRPVDGTIYFAAGQQHAVRGEMDLAFAKWRHAFHLGSEYRQKLVDALGNYFSAAFLIEQLQPDADGLRRLMKFYAKRKSLDDMQIIGQRLAATITEQVDPKSPEDNLRALKEIATVYESIDDMKQACTYYQAAIQQDRDNYNLRWSLARCLVANNRLDEAIRELEWCQRQRPYDQRVEKLIGSARQRVYR